MTATLVSDLTSPFGTYRAGGWERFVWKLADRHDLAASLRKRLRALVSRLWAGPFDAEADGLRFRLYPGSNYDDRKILAKGRLPERGEHVLLARHLRQGCVFVDVGANVGSHTLAAARAGARVLAVEANPATADRLAFNVAANGFAGVEIVRKAVGESHGEMALWSEPSNCGFATLVPELTTGEWAGDWRARSVTTVPLADMLAEAGIERIDVLKIDVEGFEDRVLAPYLAGLERARLPRVVMIETNCRAHWEHDCLALLARLGYRATGATDDNTVLELEASRPEGGRA